MGSLLASSRALISTVISALSKVVAIVTLLTNLLNLKPYL